MYIILIKKTLQVGRRVSYGKEITGYVEKQRIRKLTGVKGKELMMWLTLSDIFIDDSSTGLLTCRTPSGMVRSFPASAFNLTHEDAWWSITSHRSSQINSYTLNLYIEKQIFIGVLNHLYVPVTLYLFEHKGCIYMKTNIMHEQVL